MTPLDISNHKKNHIVHIHVDVRNNAKDYCKTHMNQSQWTYKQNTNMYEDTFFFEFAHDARDFCSYFKINY